VCKAPPISAAESSYVDSGNRRAFWESRLPQGDTIAETALDILNHDGLGGNLANQRLIGSLLVRSPGATPAALISEVRAIGVELMGAHAAAVTQFQGLSAGNVAAYHFNVFARHGLPSTTFGGTPFSGTEREAERTAHLPALGWMHCQ
jgi:hypothetical protein